jgi:hypothetical protein
MIETAKKNTFPQGTSRRCIDDWYDGETGPFFVHYIRLTQEYGISYGEKRGLFGFGGDVIYKKQS